MNISCVARMFSIRPKTLHHWYKDDLSGYTEAIANKRWGEKQLLEVDKETGEVLKEVPVPIAKSENFGSQMTIDEKQIGKKMYTIMTNTDTGKIALLAQTMKVAELREVVEKYVLEKVGAVTSISCDMSPSFKRFCKETFPNAQLVVDKFHVVKHVMDALQQVRRELKIQCVNQKKKSGKRTSADAENKWTEIEMLERSRYMLLKKEDEWEQTEKETMKHLFANYPTLEKAYELSQKIRQWYGAKNIGTPTIVLEKELYNWYDQVDESNLSAFKAVRKMVEKHQDDIMNYFKKGNTNAKAENMNGKIQRFFANNFGIKDRDFFLYRLAGYFS